MVQPEGMRPSDIAKARAEAVRNGQGSDMADMHADEMGATDMEESDDTMLSQVPTSQQSILLWDDLRLLVEARTSVSEQEQTLVNKAVSDLGLERLEDGVLHRLCIDEIFEQDDASKAEQGDDVMDGAGEGEQTRKTPLQLSYKVDVKLGKALVSRLDIMIKKRAK
ncbi:hypothetical protein BGX29_008260 [Mortierella sp. GBA35]|nr:hypothetical protein BGX29_008260 [Mortierella sp. GBA35]